MLPGTPAGSKEGTCARPAIDFRLARFSWIAFAMDRSLFSARAVALVPHFAGERVAGSPRDGQPGLVEQVAVTRTRLEADGVMHAHRAVSARLDREQIAGRGLHVEEGLASQALHHQDLSAEQASVGHHLEVLRADAQGDLRAPVDATSLDRHVDRSPAREAHRDHAALQSGHGSAQEVHLRRSDEACHELVVRVVVQLQRRAHLLDEARSEEHTSELQSLAYLVCRLLLEKKKTIEIQT